MKTREPRYGWVVTAAAALMLGYSFGSLVIVSVFLRPLEAEFGWTRADTSLAYAGSALAAGILGIGMGRLVDRVTHRPIIVAGALLLGTGHLLLSGMDSLWEMYLYYWVVLALGVACFMVPLISNVGFWFERHKGIAIGLVMGGQSLGGGVMPYIARWLLDDVEWRQAYWMLGVGGLALLVPLALLIRQPPGLARAQAAGRQMAEQGPMSDAALRRFLAVAIVACCICMATPVIHLYPLALEAGLSAETAARLLATMMLVSIVGRVGIGKVADHIGGVRALLLASALQTTMLYGFIIAPGLSSLYLVAVLFGIGYGGVIPSYAIIVREKIAPNQVGATMGVIFFFGMLGMSLGGFLGGVLHDWSGAYPAAYAVGTTAGVVNLLIVGSLFLRLRTATGLVPLPH